jgi:glycosyltransferase involved in cell wall biosynthesis
MVDGVRIRAVAKSKSRIERMTRGVARVYREAARQEAEVYHFHDPELIPVGVLLKARGKKVVYDIHEEYPTKVLAKYYIPRWLRPPLAWLTKQVENLSCQYFSALVTVSPPLARRFDRLNRNTALVQNFALLEEFGSLAEVPWSQRACAVAYTGSLAVIRGVREMVQAMGLLPDRLPATLKLAGSFRPECLRDELEQLPGWRRVEDVGPMEWGRMARLISCVRAGLMLDYPIPAHTFGYSTKTFEYMAVAIPVIATSECALEREVIRKFDCGLLVDPLNPKAIAEAIEYILTHPTEAEAMGRRGRRAVEHYFNWETEERELLQLYAGLVDHIAEIQIRHSA